MNSFLKINRQTKSLAGVLAMVATVVVLGAPLSLAEYYAQTGSADHVGANSMASQVVPGLPRKT